MTRIVDGFFQLLKFALVLGLALMVVLVFGNVVLRYGFNLGITVSEELSRFLFVWITFIGAIVAMREHAHLGVDTLVKRLPAAGKKLCLVASQCLMLYATWLFLQGSWEQTQISLDVNATAPVTGMSMAMFYGVGVVFSVCAGALLINNLYRVLTGKLREDELVMVRESEEETELEALQELARQEQRATADPAHASDPKERGRP